MDTKWLPGLYKVLTTTLNIRKEPRVLWTNVFGKLKVGDSRQVYEFLTNDKNEVWGRISEYDSAGKALWICAKNINREFLKLVPSTDPIVTIPGADQLPHDGASGSSKIELIVDGKTVFKNF